MKRINSIILILCVLVNCLYMPVSALEVDKNEEAIQMLADLNLIEYENDEGFLYEESVTRAEFIEAIIKIFALDASMFSGNELYFFDVPQTHPSYQGISLGLSLNWISPSDTMLFYPNREITNNEVIKIVLSSMGYQEIAEAKGGYPTGYLRVASELKISSGDAGSITKGDMCRILYSAIQKPILKQVSVQGTEKISLEKDESVTILSEYHDIYKAEGIVRANGYTTFYGESDLQKEKVNIDGYVYYIGDTDADQYLGKEITFFYKDDNDTNTILAIDKSKIKCEELLINAEDIIDVDRQKTSITYIDNDKTQKVNLSNPLFIIYNGIAYPEAGYLDLKPQNGSITLLDNDEDGNFEFIFINNKETFVVGSIDKIKECVYDKFTNNKLELNSKDVDYRLLKDDKPITFNDLKEYDVISVFKSRDGSLVKGVISSEVITGIPTTITEDGDYTFLQIEDKEYRVLPRVTETIDLHTKMKFYLDAENNIVASEAMVTKNYGFLYGIEIDKLFSETYRLGIIDSSNNSKTISVEGKILLNGSSVDAEEILTVFCDSDKKVVPQLVAYKADAANGLISIESAKDNTAGDIELGNTDFTLEKVTGADEYLYLNGMFISKINTDDEFAIHAETKVFIIPETVSGESIDTEKIKVESKAYFKNSERYTQMEAYDYSATGVADAVVIKKTVADDVKTEAQLFVLESVVEAMDEQGLEGVKIYGYINGRKQSYFVSDSATLASNNLAPLDSRFENWKITDAKKGDLLQLYINKSLVEIYRPIYTRSFGTISKIYQQTGGSYAEYPELECILSKIENYDSQGILLDLNGTKKRYTTNAKLVVYIYDENSDRLETGNINDILSIKNAGTQNASNVFVHANRKVVQSIIIYR